MTPPPSYGTTLRMSLRLCPSCQRHVKLEDPACPFCGAREPARAGAMATTMIGLALAAGCTSPASTPATPAPATPAPAETAPSETAPAAALYGGPPIEARGPSADDLAAPTSTKTEQR